MDKMEICIKVKMFNQGVPANAWPHFSGMPGIPWSDSLWLGSRKGGTYGDQGL